MNFPPQTQPVPGDQYKMDPKHQIIKDSYKGSNKLENKVALITGGDSGIGRSIAVHFVTKGAVVSFTRSLSGALAQKGIRVNAVAPGPIWTPLIVSTFPPEKVKKFGQDVPLGRAGQPSEVAPSFVFLRRMTQAI